MSEVKKDDGFEKSAGALLIGAVVIIVGFVLALPTISFFLTGYFIYWAWYSKPENQIKRTALVFLFSSVFYSTMLLTAYTIFNPDFRDISKWINKIYGYFTKSGDAFNTFLNWASFDAPGFVNSNPTVAFWNFGFWLSVVGVAGSMYIGYRIKKDDKKFGAGPYLYLRNIFSSISKPLFSFLSYSEKKHIGYAVATYLVISIGLVNLTGLQEVKNWSRVNLVLLWMSYGIYSLFFSFQYNFFTKYITGWLEKFGVLEKNEKEKYFIEVGQDEFRRPIGISLHQLNHHVHVVGQTGFGKSSFLRNLYAHHFKNNLGFMFIDLKADYDTVSEIVGLAKHHNRLHDLQIFHLSDPSISVPYNILSRGNATELKDKIIASLDWSEVHYKKIAERFLLTVLKGFVNVRDKQNKTVTLLDLHRCLVDSIPIKLLAMEVSDLEIKKDLLSLAEEFSKPGNKSNLEGLRTDIEILVNSEFGDLLCSSKPGLDILNAIENNKIVYILLDSQRFGESAKRLGKMLIADLKVASGTIVESKNRSERNHYSIIIDEFADIATDDFVGFLNRARGSGLGLVVAHQDLADLDKYSNTLKRQVLGNTLVTVAFLQKNAESAETLASIAGTKTIAEVTKQTKDSFLARDYTGMGSEKRIEEFIIHPNVFKNLNKGECVIITKNPSRANKVKVNLPEFPTAELDHETLSLINLVEHVEKEALNLKIKEFGSPDLENGIIDKLKNNSTYDPSRGQEYKKWLEDDQQSPDI